MMLSPARSLAQPRRRSPRARSRSRYALLLALPETRHPLELMAPHVNGVLLSAVGAAIAMSSFTAALRWSRADEDAELERAT